MRKPTHHTSPEAIQNLHGDDRASFSLVYDHYYLPVYYFIQRYVDDPQEAEDITADSFIKLWQYAQTNAVENVKAFLYTIARNGCLDHLKSVKTKQEKEKEINFLATQDTRNAFVIAEIKAEIMQSIHAEIEKLPYKCREIFKLSYIEGMKNAEIAARMKMTERTVYNLRAIALKNLRLALKDKEWIITLLMLLHMKSQ